MLKRGVLFHLVFLWRLELILLSAAACHKLVLYYYFASFSMVMTLLCGNLWGHLLWFSRSWPSLSYMFVSLWLFFHNFWLTSPNACLIGQVSAFVLFTSTEWISVMFQNKGSFRVMLNFWSHMLRISTSPTYHRILCPALIADLFAWLESWWSLVNCFAWHI